MTQPLRVAHITTVDVSLRYLLLNQLQTLQQAGYEVVGISAPGREIPIIQAAGIPHIAVPMKRTFSPIADVFTLWRLYRVIRREHFSIVHTHTPKAGLLGQLAARLAGVPIVINTLHGFYFHDYMPAFWRRFYITLEKIAARCSDSILSQNEEDIQTALAEGICQAAKIKQLGNGIDLSQFNSSHITLEAIRQAKREIGIPDDSPVVGFVGRLAAKRKGFLDFLAAAQEIKERIPNVRFLIVGQADVGKPDAVEPSVAKEYGIETQCLFLGQRPNAELPLLYSLMNVLVLPSLFEGLPRAVMEASAMGVPSVVTDVKGNREAVEHGRTGLLVPLGNVQALSAAIIELLSDRERARRMSMNAVRMARQCFDERLVFDKVKSEYVRLLGQKGLRNPKLAGGA